MTTAAEIRENLEKKIDGQPGAEGDKGKQGEQQTEAQKAAAKAAADAAAAATGDLDPEDLIEDGDKKDFEIPKYEEVSKDEKKRQAAFASMSTKITELQAELKTIREKPNITETEREKQLQQKLAQYELQEDPEFQKTHIAPINEAWQSIAVQLAQLGLPKADIEKMKTANLEQRATLLKGKEAALPFLATLFGDYDRRRVSAHQAMLKGSEELKRLRSQRQARGEQEISAIADTVIAEVAKEHKLLRKEDGKDDRNKRVEADHAEAKRLATEAMRDPKVALRIALLATAAKRYPSMVTKLLAQLSESQKTALKRSANLPKLGGDGGGRQPSGDKADISNVPQHQKSRAMREDMEKRFAK